jgi:transketolase
MLGVAAGLATTGYVPFVSTFVAFAVVRPLDQIRVLIAQTGLNVKICGGYAGLFTGVTGKTHLIVDDLSIMRAMPGMITVAPADDVEVEQVLRWAAGYDGPIYIRLVRDATQRLFDEKYVFAPGRAVIVRDGGDVTLISTGTQTPRVVDAADLLAARGIQAHILHVPTLKPLDTAAIVAAADRTGIVVTVEEGTVIGGLGGAVTETLSELRPTVVKRLGLQDVYGESASNSELLELYGLSAARVADQVQAFVQARSTAGHASPAARINS